MNKKEDEVLGDDKSQTTEDIGACDDDTCDNKEVEEESKSDEANKEESEQKEDYKQKYEDMNDKYIRAYAEFENDKRRIEKEKSNAIGYVIEKFVKDFIPCIDSLELAIASANNKEVEPKELLKALMEGVELTRTQFAKALDKNGIKEIDTSKGFDPNLHNAIIQTEDKDKEDGNVAAVMQKGYQLGDRVIRPSMVSVVQNNK
jgi:molecular chaperone GrpE